MKSPQITLKINTNPIVCEQISRNKKIWNFVKGDLKKLLQAQPFDANISVQELEDKTFLIDDQATDKKYHISPDFSFAKELHIETEDLVFAGFFLSILILLQTRYKKAFFVECNAYKPIALALTSLKKATGISVPRSTLRESISFPEPGRQTIKSKPMTNAEKSKRRDQNKLARGMKSFNTWLDEDTKKALQNYAKDNGLSTQEAVNKIIPLGLKVATHFLDEKPST